MAILGPQKNLHKSVAIGTGLINGVAAFSAQPVTTIIVLWTICSLLVKASIGESIRIKRPGEHYEWFARG